jgi:hypothetical protein
MRPAAGEKHTYHASFCRVHATVEHDGAPFEFEENTGPTNLLTTTERLDGENVATIAHGNLLHATLGADRDGLRHDGEVLCTSSTARRRPLLLPARFLD